MKVTSRQKKILLTDAIISIIIPTYNDEKIVSNRIMQVNSVMKKLKAHFEIILVDRNSTDATIEILRKLHNTIPQMRTIILSKKYETEIALTAGLDNCIGDYAILFDIHTDPPKMIEVILDKLLISFDIVAAINKEENSNFGILEKLFIKIIKKLSSHDFQYHENYLIGLTRKAINSITRTRRKNRNFSYIHSLIGLKKQTIMYKTLKRYRRLPTKNLVSVIFSSIDIILSNSFKPIRFLTLLGMLASIGYLLYVVIIVILTIVSHKQIAPQGWVTLSSILGLMFFLLFSLLTLLSEYIIRILNETRNEPFYFISEEIDKSVILPKEEVLNII